MLYKLEWKTPHERPNGKTVAEWVKSVRWFEENGWLRDPDTVEWPTDPEHPANRARALDNKVCPPLCWRPRCRRQKRCPHRMPLAVREFMPEFAVYMARAVGDPPFYTGPLDEGKMLILAEIFDAALPGKRT